MKRLLLLWIGCGLALQAQPAMPPQLRNVGIDQKLDTQLPPGIRVIDESGRDSALGEYFRGKPVVLALVYYKCPMLCDMVLNGMLRAFRTLSLDAGRDFDVVTVSFDPNDTPAIASQKKANYLEKYGRPGAAEGWHFLTAKESGIQELTAAAGFRYTYDENAKQFIHASAIMVLTPEGRLSRYFYGVEYPPRDLRLALVEASNFRIGNRVDQLLLYCFHYDPTTGKYGLIITRTIRLGGMLTVLALVGGIVALSRRPRGRGEVESC